MGDPQTSKASYDHLLLPEDSFSADNFIANIWTPEKLEKKRKRQSGPEYSPEDRCSSMFYRNYIQPAGEDVATKHSIHNKMSKKGKRLCRRFRVPYAVFKEICQSMVEEGYF